MNTLAWSLLLAVSTVSNPNRRPDDQLPPTSQGPTIPAKGYHVAPIREGVYWVTDGIYNAMFLVYETGVVAVDAPPTIGDKMLKAIREVTKKPITHLVYSHSHTDHIGAAYLFPKSAKIVAHRDTALTLKRRMDSRRPVPSITFEKSFELRVGSQKLQLDYKGPNHESGNIFIFAPKQKVLMLVDVVYPGWVPYKNLGISKDVPEYLKAHDDILKYDFDTLVAGHVTRLGTREDVRVAKRLVQDIISTAGKALQTTDFMESAKETGFDNKWKLYETYFDKVVEKTYQDVRSRWLGKLGGVDTYLRDNCWVVCEALVVDFAPPGAPKVSTKAKSSRDAHAHDD